MSSRQCKLSPNSFCYVCGKYIITKKKRNFTEAIKRAYFQYFQIPVSNLDKKWVPGSVLMNWAAGKNKYLTFGIPMQWREPTNHATDCYFCLTKTFGFNNKNKKHVQYPDVPSVTKPVLHSDGVPYPSLPSSSNSKNDSGSINLIEESSWKQCDLDNDDDDFMEDESKGEPHMITQSELNDLMRDLQLSKAKSELLASRLRFHQYLKLFEERYQGFWDKNMLADYGWSILRETNPDQYKRRSTLRHF